MNYKYKNQDLNIDDKARIICMEMEKSRQIALMSLEKTERLLKDQPDLVRQEKIKQIQDILNSGKMDQMSELMKGYRKAPDIYRSLRFRVFLEAQNLTWLEDRWDIDQIEKVVWLFVETLYVDRSITKRQFNKIKKITELQSELSSIY